MDEELGYSNFQFIQEEILDPLDLKNTFGSLSDVNMAVVMSGYHVGHPHDLKADEHGMLATAEDVGIFLRALNEGSLFEAGEQEIYASIYEYEQFRLGAGLPKLCRISQRPGCRCCGILQHHRF